MKIAIVCGHYMPDMGYVEVHLSRAFAQLGHQVSVVTSTVIPSYVSHLYHEIGKEPEAVNVVRLKPVFQLGQIVIARGIKTAIKRISPDLVIAIGLGKNFPKPVFDLNFPVVTLFGDNAHSYVANTVMRKFKTDLLFSVFKRKTYRKAIDKSDLLLAYTPESFEAAAKMVSGRWADVLRKEKGNISLGFWPSEFFFNQAIRDSKRTELGWAKECNIVITATRIKAEKNLDTALAVFDKLSDDYVWLLLGSGEDDYAKGLLNTIEGRLGKGRVKMLPHQNRSTLNEFYNAADMALYTVPAISIFEAVGTGLPVVSPPEKSLSHIPGKGVEMILSALHAAELERTIQNLNHRDDARTARAEAAEHHFGWKGISESILAAIK